MVTDFERWNARFSVSEYIFGTEPNAFLASQKSLLPKRGRALAVADGEGRNGVWLAEQGLDVLSIDFSPAAQDKARALARMRGVTITTETVDVTTWTWPANTFEVVVIIFTQFTTPAERDEMFAGIRRALKPDGLLLLEGYTPKQLEYGTGGPKQIEHMYTRKLLEDAFAGFHNVIIREYETEMREGSAHGGRSALIDFIGRKERNRGAT